MLDPMVLIIKPQNKSQNWEGYSRRMERRKPRFRKIMEKRVYHRQEFYPQIDTDPGKARQGGVKTDGICLNIKLQ